MSSSPWICECICHTEIFEGFVFHLIPCCTICPVCGDKIKTLIYAMHIKDCKTINDEFKKAMKNVLPILTEEEFEFLIEGELSFSRDG